MLLVKYSIAIVYVICVVGLYDTALGRVSPGHIDRYWFFVRGDEKRLFLVSWWTKSVIAS